MATVKFDYDGYGQIELNNVAFRRDGRIEAQCALDPTNFASTPAENGMLLAVDKANGVIKLPTATETLPIALHYSTEHLYDERTPGLNNFKLERGTFYPRMGYLAVGDLFTTNTVCFSDAETGFTPVSDDVETETVDETQTASEHFLATLTAGYKETTYYGGIDVSGRIKVSASKPTYGPVLKVVKVYTMPDGTPGFKFQVQEA